MDNLIKEKCELQEQIIDELFSSLSNSKPKNNSYFNSYFNKKIEEIFKLEVEYLGLNYKSPKNRKNDVELFFESMPDSKEKGSFKINVKNKHCLYINTAVDGFKKIKSSNQIERLDGLKSILKTLFHELRHLKHYLLIKANISSKFVLRNAKEFILASSDAENYCRIYKENHDNFAIEADADYISSCKRNDLISKFSDIKDKYRINISKSNRDINRLVVNDQLVDRDLFIDRIIDDLILNKKKSKLFEDYPVLLKEYNKDFTKKTIVELMINMNKEIEDIMQISDIETADMMLSETTEFYYELIYKRIKLNDPFELYDAIKLYGNEEIMYLCENINTYFNKDKKMKLSLLKDKYESERDLYKDSAFPFNKNDGKIIVNKNGVTSLVDVNDYISKNVPKYDKTFLNIFFRSEAFKHRIPKDGTFVLKNGVKMSLPQFINNIVIPELRKSNSKLTIVSDFDAICLKTLKPFYEVDFINECQSVNSEFQKKDSVINSTMDSKILKDENITDLDESIEMMRMIRNIDSDDVMNKIEEFMLVYLENDNEDYYYVFTKNQLDYYNNLIHIARILTNSEIFNPNKIDYSKKLFENDSFKNIKYNVENYYSLLESGKDKKR